MTGVEIIAAERQRQIEQEGWNAEHDEEHRPDVLAIAGACYALPEAVRHGNLFGKAIHLVPVFAQFGLLWPWKHEWWKPARPADGDEGRVRELAKAGALIAAEIDRMQHEALNP